jgi:hypothetical protein
MTINFENENDVIVFALEKIISFARNNHYILLAQSVSWISSIIGLQQGLIVHIDNIRKREIASKEFSVVTSEERIAETDIRHTTIPVHPSRRLQVPKDREVSSTPRDLSEDQRLDQVLEDTETFLEESSRARNTWQQNRIHPLPQSKRQLRIARQIKRLQEARDKETAKRNQRIRKIGDSVISNFSKK